MSASAGQESSGSSSGGADGSSGDPVAIPTGRMINIHEGQLRRFEGPELLLLSLPRRRRLAKILGCVLFVGGWFACLALIGRESEKVVAVHVEGRNLTRERELMEEAKIAAERTDEILTSTTDASTMTSTTPGTTWSTPGPTTTFSLQRRRERLQELEDTYNRLANDMQDAIERYE